MSTVDHPFVVGQKVLIDSMNRRGHDLDEGTVVKIGRTLVHVQHYTRIEKFELDGRYIKDGFGHEWVLTEEEYAEREHRAQLKAELAMHGFAAAKHGDFPHSTETLEKVIALLEAELDAAEVAGE